MDDDECGEMVIEKSDVELNVVDVIGEVSQGNLESNKLDIMTVGAENSRGGNVGGAGDKEARERETVVDKDKNLCCFHSV